MLRGHGRTTRGHGRHWCAIYIMKSGTGFFFGSYGRRPMKRIEDFLNKLCTKWYFCNEIIL